MGVLLLLNNLRPQLSNYRYLDPECHTEQNRSTWHAESSAPLDLWKDLTRVSLVDHFGILNLSPRRSLQAVEMSPHSVPEMSKQHSSAV